MKSAKLEKYCLNPGCPKVPWVLEGTTNPSRIGNLPECMWVWDAEITAETKARNRFMNVLKASK